MRKRKEQVSPEYLREALDYNPETGKLYWKVRPSHHGRTEKSKSYVNNFAGQEAFTARHSEGYKCGMIDARQYLAHRVIWAVYYGEWPQGVIDHINGDKADNRIANLRVATLSQNAQNTRRKRVAKSGYRGVHPGSKGTWDVIISYGGKNKCFGNFDDPEEAARHYDRFILDQRGEFAVTNFPREEYGAANVNYAPIPAPLPSTGVKNVYVSGNSNRFHYSVRRNNVTYKKGGFKTVEEAANEVNEIVAKLDNLKRK